MKIPRATWAVLALAVGCAGLEFGYRRLVRGECARLSPDRAKPGFEIYVVGESTPAGEPYERRISFPMLASRMFDNEIAGRKIRVWSLARHGESIYPQYITVRQALSCHDKNNPGALLIYSGNNDDLEHLSRFSILEHLKRSVLEPSTFLQDLFYLFELRVRTAYPRSLQTYEYYLRRTIQLGLRKGLTPVLSTVVSNKADIDPGLFERRGMPPASTIESIFREGESLQSKRQYARAIAHYEQAASSFPAQAIYARYRVGKCRQALGQHEEAKTAFQGCVDASLGDAFGRATTSQNALLRRLAEEYNIPLVDAERIFEANSLHGIVGDDLFSDGHHPNIRGHLLLAQGFAQALSQSFREPIKNPLRYSGGIFFSLAYGRSSQAMAFLNNGNWLLSTAIGHLYPGQRLDLAEARFRSALTLEPENFYAWLGLGLVEAARRGLFLREKESADWIRSNIVSFAGVQDLSKSILQELERLLERAGVPESMRRRLSSTFESGQEERRLKRRNDAMVQLKVASALAEAGHAEEALEYFRRSFAIDPGFAEAYAGYGMALSLQGRWPEAAGQYASALEIDPQNALARNNLGIAYMAMEQWGVAAEHFRSSLALSPEDEQMKRNLELTLARLPAAQAESLAAVGRALRLHPHDTDLLSKFGNRAYREGFPRRAVTSLERLVRLEPRNARARQVLEQAQSRCAQAAAVADSGRKALEDGHADQAIALYRRSLALDPDMTENRLNLALLLESHGSADDAIAEYRRALADRPDISWAQRRLGTILAAQGRRGEAAVRLRMALAIAPIKAATP